MPANKTPGAYLEGETFLLSGAEKRLKKNGDAFLHLRLMDRTGSLEAKKWETTEQEIQRLAEASFVRVSGQVKEYQGAVELHLDRAEPVAAGDLDPADFLPATSYDRAELRRSLDGCIAELKDPGIAGLVRTVLRHPRVAPRLDTAPAATELHHAYVGGLLEHMVSISRLAYQVSRLYPELDRDLLLAGAILHDIGKVEELTVGKGFQYSDEGKLKGHITLGVELIQDAARGVPGLDPATLDKVVHLILSHHGTKEWGSPVAPAIPEAVALHHMDNLDAKLAGARAALEAARGSPGNWTQYLKMFGGALYRGDEKKG